MVVRAHNTKTVGCLQLCECNYASCGELAIVSVLPRLTLCVRMCSLCSRKYDCAECMGFPGGASGKEPACQCKRRGFEPWVKKIVRGHGNPLQYSCLEKPLGRGAWQVTGYRIAQSWTRLKSLKHARTYGMYESDQLCGCYSRVQFLGNLCEVWFDWSPQQQ